MENEQADGGTDKQYSILLFLYNVVIKLDGLELLVRVWFLKIILTLEYIIIVD